MENYLIAMAVFACLYALLALGLNLVWGMAGMINLGLVGFFGDRAHLRDEFRTRPRSSRSAIICGLGRRGVCQLPGDGNRRRIAGQRSDELQNTNSKPPDALSKFVSLRRHAARSCIGAADSKMAQFRCSSA